MSVISRTVTSSTTGASIQTGAAWADQFIGILQVNNEPPIKHERCRNLRRSNGRGIASHPFVRPIKDNFLATGVNRGPLMAHAFRTGTEQECALRVDFTRSPSGPGMAGNCTELPPRAHVSRMTLRHLRSIRLSRGKVTPLFAPPTPRRPQPPCQDSELCSRASCGPTGRRVDGQAGAAETAC